MTYGQIYTLVFSIWAQMHPGAPKLATAPLIADGITRAVQDERPIDQPSVAAVMAVYAVKESWLDPHAVGDGGRSCSYLQMRCKDIAGLSLADQGRLWLSWVKASSLAAVDSSPSRARRRFNYAMKLLREVENQS